MGLTLQKPDHPTNDQLRNQNENNNKLIIKLTAIEILGKTKNLLISDNHNYYINTTDTSVLKLRNLIYYRFCIKIK